MDYADDFRVVAPERHMDEIWDHIESEVSIDTPEVLGLLLGCDHRIPPIPCPYREGRKIKIIEWDMKDQIFPTNSWLDGKSLRKEQTPLRSLEMKVGVAAPITFGPRLKGPWSPGAKVAMTSGRSLVALGI